MGIYTVDKQALIRRILYPDEKDITNLIMLAGNSQFTHHGYDELGMPIISCDHKPVDSTLYGLKWIDKFPEV